MWNVLTAIGERTKGDLGPGVTCPTFRFHPAIVAQAAATLEAMYPGRTWLGLGSGEALNEHVVGSATGRRHLSGSRGCSRRSRSSASCSIPAAATSSTTASTSSSRSTRLWTLPDGPPPPIYIATAGPITAKKTGQWADGLITVGAPEEKIEMIFERCREGCREEGKDPDTFRFLGQLHLSWAETDEEALASAMTEWPNGGMKFPKQDIKSPHDFAAMAKLVRA